MIINILGLDNNFEHLKYPNEEKYKKEICSIFEICLGGKNNKDIFNKCFNRLELFKELKEEYKERKICYFGYSRFTKNK